MRRTRNIYVGEAPNSQRECGYVVGLRLSARPGIRYTVFEDGVVVFLSRRMARNLLRGLAKGLR